MDLDDDFLPLKQVEFFNRLKAVKETLMKRKYSTAEENALSKQKSTVVDEDFLTNSVDLPTRSQRAQQGLPNAPLPKKTEAAESDQKNHNPSNSESIGHKSSTLSDNTANASSPAVDSVASRVDSLSQALPHATASGVGVDMKLNEPPKVEDTIGDTRDKPRRVPIHVPKPPPESYYPMALKIRSDVIPKTPVKMVTDTWNKTGSLSPSRSIRVHNPQSLDSTTFVHSVYAVNAQDATVHVSPLDHDSISKMPSFTRTHSVNFHNASGSLLHSRTDHDVTTESYFMEVNDVPRTRDEIHAHRLYGEHWKEYIKAKVSAISDRTCKYMPPNSSGVFHSHNISSDLATIPAITQLYLGSLNKKSDVPSKATKTKSRLDISEFSMPDGTLDYMRRPSNLTGRVHENITNGEGIDIHSAKKPASFTRVSEPAFVSLQSPQKYLENLIAPAPISQEQSNSDEIAAARTAEDTIPINANGSTSPPKDNDKYDTVATTGSAPLKKTIEDQVMDSSEDVLARKLESQAKDSPTRNDGFFSTNDVPSLSFRNGIIESSEIRAESVLSNDIDPKADNNSLDKVSRPTSHPERGINDPPHMRNETPSLGDDAEEMCNKKNDVELLIETPRPSQELDLVRGTTNAMEDKKSAKENNDDKESESAVSDPLANYSHKIRESLENLLSIRPSSQSPMGKHEVYLSPEEKEMSSPQKEMNILLLVSMIDYLFLKYPLLWREKPSKWEEMIQKAERLMTPGGAQPQMLKIFDRLFPQYQDSFPRVSISQNYLLANLYSLIALFQVCTPEGYLYINKSSKSMEASNNFVPLVEGSEFICIEAYRLRILLAVFTIALFSVVINSQEYEDSYPELFSVFRWDKQERSSRKFVGPTPEDRILSTLLRIGLEQAMSPPSDDEQNDFHSLSGLIGLGNIENSEMKSTILGISHSKSLSSTIRSTHLGPFIDALEDPTTLSASRNSESASVKSNLVPTHGSVSLHAALRGIVKKASHSQMSASFGNGDKETIFMQSLSRARSSRPMVTTSRGHSPVNQVRGEVLTSSSKFISRKPHKLNLSPPTRNMHDPLNDLPFLRG